MNIIKPELIIDLNIINKNIQNIIQKAKANNLEFRPHFKTHQSAEIGNMFRKYGVDKIAVSSVMMAEYFADNGWKDIAVAFPVNILEIEKVNNLLNKNIRISLLIDNPLTLKFLEKNIKREIGIFIELDLGNNRSGIEYSEYPLIQDLIDGLHISEKMKFSGFMVHSGETYDLQGKQQIQMNFDDNIAKLRELYSHINYSEKMYLSFGDTPSISLMSNFEMIDEIRPGNFVFYDAMQLKIGSCSFDEIACAVAAPVVSMSESRSEIVIYCGAVHLSKDFIEADGYANYGLVALFNKNSFSWTEPIGDVYVKKISQEHGIIKANKKMLKEITIGDLLAIIPIHSCLTADKFNYYFDTELNKIRKL